jgi:rod shape-determining protein MreC
MFQTLKQWILDHLRGFMLTLTVLVSLFFLMRTPRAELSFVRWGTLHLISIGQTVLSLPIRLSELDKENRHLRSRLLTKVSHESRLTALELENQRLRRMLLFRQTADLHLLAADVVGRGSGSPSTAITVGVGSIDSVQSFMAVVSPQGLVGRVDPTPAPHLSMIRLITDQGIRVAAVVENSTRPMGIVRHDGTVLTLMNVPVESRVDVGERVVTSGLGGIFPGGLLIGTITDVKEDPHALFKSVTLKPSARLDRLEEVFIVREKGRKLRAGRIDALDR